MNDLLIYVRKQATVLLADAADFYPFGSVITTQGALVPLAAWTGNDYPAVEELIGLLEKAIAEKFRRNEISTAAICIDVNFRLTPTSELVEAIHIKELQGKQATTNHYLLYRVEEKQVNIYEHLIYVAPAS
jgi:hypothetical protein